MIRTIGLAHGLGGLRGVFGEVSGDLPGGDVPDPVVTLTGRMSSCVPQFMSQPGGLAGCDTVANQVAAAAWRMASPSSMAVRCDGGGRILSGSARSYPSSRRGMEVDDSACLVFSDLDEPDSLIRAGLASRSRRRRRLIMVRRHSSGA